MTTIHLTDDEVSSLIACLGDPRIWGGEDTAHIAAVLLKLGQSERTEQTESQ